MWSRLRTRLLNKPNNHSVDFVKTGGDDVVRDVGQYRKCDEKPTSLGEQISSTSGLRCSSHHRRYQMALIDKCPCGSPRVMKTCSQLIGGGSDSPRRDRKSDALTSLGRKSTDVVGGCSSHKNEYTKPTVAPPPIEDRKKATSSTNAGASTAHARREESLNAKNAQLSQPSVPRPSQSGRGDQGQSVGKVEELPAAKLTFDDSDDDDNGTGNGKKTGSSSNYTSLNYDINYVRVSPPKMTRRLKRVEETSSDAAAAPAAGKLTREAQLQASRLGTTTVDGQPAPPTMTRHSREVKLPQESSQETSGCNSLKDEKSAGKSAPVPPNFVGKSADKTGNKVIHDGNQSAKKESDYIALADLQSGMTLTNGTAPKAGEDNARVDHPLAPEVDGLAKSLPPTDPQADDPARAVTATMYNDGENSFLQFTFTVKLENDAVKKQQQQSDVGDHQKPPVVSGTVNIVKSMQQQEQRESSGNVADDSGRQNVVKPVITVGVQGGTVVVPNSDAQPHLMRAEAPSHVAETATAAKFTCRPVGIAGIQVTSEDTRRHVQLLENNVSGSDGKGGGRPGSAEQKKHQPADGKRVEIHKTWPRRSESITAYNDAELQYDHVDCACKQTPSETFYHSLLATGRDGECCGVGSGGYDGVRSADVYQQGSETTHMSWDEVMLEARSLGIPLNLPGGKCRSHATSATMSHRRSSTSDGPVQSRGHHQSQQQQQQQPQTDQNRGTRSNQQSSTLPTGVRTPGGSPFKEKFKLYNLFGGKKTQMKDDEAARRSAAAGVSGNGGGRAGTVGKQQQVSQTLPRQTGVRTNCCDVCGLDQVDRGGGSPCIVRRRPESATMFKRSLSTPRPAASYKLTTLTTGSESSSSSAQYRTTSGCCCSTVEQQLVSRSHRREEGYKPSGRASDTATFSPLTQRTRSNISNAAAAAASTDRNSNNGQDFINGLQQLQKCGWYWGALGFEEAESRLSDLPDGSFLVRDSSDDRYILSLSFRSQDATHHTRIEHYKGVFSFYSQQNGPESSNIVEFINNAVSISQAGYCLYYLRPRAPGLSPTPVRLLYPVLKRPPSLLELSRSVVQQQNAVETTPTGDK